MIHVPPQPEPSNFDTAVRRKGQVFLRKIGLTGNAPHSTNVKLEPYWRACLDELYTRYEGICAYLAVFFERVTGTGSVDHFIAKSRNPELAYEWSNYRLACTAMNSRKRDFEDVLDPFDIQDGWFRLELVTGHIYPSPSLDARLEKKIRETIDRLGLDTAASREMRARHYQDYREGYYTEDYFRRRSPFVYLEAARQGLL